MKTTDEKNKIVLLSYENTVYDGRLKQLIKALSIIGHVECFQRKINNYSKESIINGKGYLSFILHAVKYGLGRKQVDILVIDNRKCILPGKIIKLFKHPKITVLDCRELYFFNDVHHLAGKIGCLIEGPFIKKADIVSAANKERAQIMKDHYKLDDLPIVFENIRALESSDNEQLDTSLFDENCYNDEIRIISTAGCRKESFNEKLIIGISKQRRKCRLFFAGQYSPDEAQYIRNVQEKCGFDRVVLLGRVNQSTLKNIVDRCHVGIVAYSNFDNNTKYCASGKIFEFIFEGIPVVTTSNPPLKAICDEQHIGIADDTFSQGISRVIENYDQYRDNVIKYKQNISVEKNNENYAKAISERLSQLRPK